ncbi:MAG: EAL domain-containing protein [Candidatus Dormibacteria bacterium]|jgi:diguanylate cyclase (GGDEF)-like protein/PAS domain S-box-containing protein
MNVGAALVTALVLLALLTACAAVVRQSRRDRSRAEERAADLNASATRLRAVADAVTEAILILDGEGQVTLANRAAHRLFGATDGTLTGCHVEQLLPAFRPGASDLPMGGSGPGQAEVAAFRRDATGFSAQVDSRLVAEGEGRIVVVRDMSEVRAQSAALLHQTLHDSLTGLPNDRQFQEALLARLEVAAARRAPFSVFLLDLDRFAEVNEGLGHGVGDRLLVAVAERLRRTLRATDVVARLGGDDFAIIPGGSATPAASARIARQVLAAFKEPVAVDAHSLEAGISIGIANYPDHGGDAQTLMASAEIARRAAKQARRGWRVYTPADGTSEIEDRAVRLAELRRAIDNQELELFYQPVVRLADSALLALDATVRWRHQRHGLLTPDQFVPAAEETEIIRPLTRCVLGLAIEQQAHWRGEGHALRVNVKIAGRNVQDRQLPRAVSGLLERWGVPPASLSITVDENTTLSMEAPVLQSLAKMGVGVALDDYGSDSTSLLRLRALPFTELRLDVSLVASAHREGVEAAAVRGIVELAHALNLTVIAAGIDDEAARTSIQRLGCDAAEGRLWGDPVPSGAVIPLLRLLARQSRFPGLSRYRPGSPPPPRTEPAETG